MSLFLNKIWPWIRIYSFQEVLFSFSGVTKSPESQCAKQFYSEKKISKPKLSSTARNMSQEPTFSGKPPSLTHGITTLWLQQALSGEFQVDRCYHYIFTQLPLHTPLNDHWAIPSCATFPCTSQKSCSLYIPSQKSEAGKAFSISDMTS